MRADYRTSWRRHRAGPALRCCSDTQGKTAKLLFPIAATGRRVASSDTEAPSNKVGKRPLTHKLETE